MKQDTYTGSLKAYGLSHGHNLTQGQSRLVGAFLRAHGVAPRTQYDHGLKTNFSCVTKCPERLLVRAFDAAGLSIVQPGKEEPQVIVSPPVKDLTPLPDETLDILVDVQHMVTTLNALCSEVERLRAIESLLRQEVARLSAESRRAMAVFGD